MKIYYDESLSNFEFWNFAASNARKLTESELDMFEAYLMLEYPEGISATKLNDWMWYDFESVCAIIGVDYDSETDTIKR